MPDLTELENDGQTSTTSNSIKMRQNTGGVPLSHADVDSNFENLRDKLNKTIIDVNALTSGSYNLSGPTGPAGADGADGADGTNGTNGTDGKGFTGGSYNASTGVVTFTSDDGLGFSTGDLRGADGTDGTNGTGGGVTSYGDAISITPTITPSSNGILYNDAVLVNICQLQRAGHFGMFNAYISWHSGTTSNPTWPMRTAITNGLFSSDHLLKDGAYFTLKWPNVGLNGVGGYALHDVKLTIWDQNSGGFFELSNDYGKATEPAWTDYDPDSSSYTSSYVRVHMPGASSGTYVSSIQASMRYMLAETEL